MAHCLIRCQFSSSPGFASYTYDIGHRTRIFGTMHAGAMVNDSQIRAYIHHVIVNVRPSALFSSTRPEARV